MPSVVKPDANVILSKMINDKGIKRNYIASKIGLSPASMSALLHGNKKFTADIAIKLGKALDIPYTIFLSESYS